MFCDKDAAYKEKIILILKSLKALMSSALCDGIIDVFEAIFPGKLPPGMFIHVKEAVSMITDAIHPDCKQNLLKDMGEAHFVL